MPKLGPLNAREVCEILVRHGFTEVRRRGSHIVMQRRDATGTTTVPVPDHDPIRRGTLRAIVRQSGIAKEEFER